MAVTDMGMEREGSRTMTVRWGRRLIRVIGRAIWIIGIGIWMRMGGRGTPMGIGWTEMKGDMRRELQIS